MQSRINGAIALALVILAGFGVSCTGGGSGGGNLLEEFDLILTASPSTGTAPLTVSFFAVPSGGAAPYTYAWDFDGDGVTDSNSSSGLFTYTASALAKVTVTDNADKTVIASRSITVQPGGGSPNPDNMTVKFISEPQAGNVPFGAQFTSFVEGGTPPFKYSWDFEADGTFDSFVANPFFLFEAVGSVQVSGNYVTYPILQVEDSRGVITTNLDDNNNDSQSDWLYPITVNPTLGVLQATARGNPMQGQAPLTVEFTGAVANGTGKYAYSWEFGDNTGTEFRRTSIATHTYVNQGAYKARVTVHDLKVSAPDPAVMQPRPQDIISTAISPWITVQVSMPQEFIVEIVSDAVAGQVPFVVSFEAMAVNGTEPIQYNWDVFDDITPTEEFPTIDNPPGLHPDAVITPHFTYKKNPTIHFASEEGGGSYVVRCVAVDSVGNTSVSNLIRVTANPNTTFPHYLANRPKVISQTFFPINRGGASAQANLDPPNDPAPRWAPRAHPAVASHPTGVTWIFGGEILDENGNFEDLVPRGDSAYMYVPKAGGIAPGTSPVGKFNTGTLGGGVIRLNDGMSPSFPGQPDAPVNGPNDTPLIPVGPGPIPTNRSTGFVIVGSAAAVYMHEPGYVETNPDGSYQGARNEYGFPYPDAANSGWGLDAPPFDTSGLGVPIIYVIGGRVAADQPVDIVQRYTPYGFGTEDLPTHSIDFNFQVTNNQADTWSNYFLRPDRDQFPDQDDDPNISQRLPGGADESLPTLPEPLYALAAVGIETGADVATPGFPGGPWQMVLTFGGIDQNGSVRDMMYWWNSELPSGEGGGDEEEEGIFSIVERLPTPRAYAQALFMPGVEDQIALVGGIDQGGAAYNTVEVFTFDDLSTGRPDGSWETFAGTLPEALEACGAGFVPGPNNEKWVLTFGGWTGKEYNYDTYDARINSIGDLVVREAIKAVPRNAGGSGQGGSAPLQISFNRFIVACGVDENGTDSIVEVLSLP